MNSQLTIRNQRSRKATNQSIPTNVKNALRSMRRQDNKQSILTRGPIDPPPVKVDVVVTKIVQDTFSTTTAETYTYEKVYNLLQNATTGFFGHMRVISCSIYGPADSTGISATVASDGATFSDHGTTGARRSVLHIRFPESVRINWFGTAQTQDIITVHPQSGTVVQFTIELRNSATS